MCQTEISIDQGVDVRGYTTVNCYICSKTYSVKFASVEELY